MSQPDSTQVQPRRSRGPITALFDLFNSVWFGIILMVLLFIYMSLASAGILHPINWREPFGPWTRWVVRESFGLTEMEAFCWWPFNLLIALFVINMVVVTLRRIRLNALNLGVWGIHTGIVILALSSVYYFSTKIEGDTPVFRRHIVVNVPGAEPARIIAQTGATTEVVGAAGKYTFQIQSINPAWPLLSGEDTGKTACSINVAVNTPAQSFIRQMLINYPQYTEDIIPGKGRAIKAVGTKLLDESVALTFDYEPQNYFFVQDSAALYMREVGATEWVERPIPNLPHYSSHIAARNEIWQPDGERPLEPNPLDIGLPASSDRDPMKDFDVRVTGRLHYVEAIESRWVAGGDRPNPFLAVDLEFDGGPEERLEMLALHPARNTAKDGFAAFRWASEPGDVEQFAQGVGSVLTVEIPDENVSLSIPVDEHQTLEENPNLPFKSIAGSAWTYRIRGAARGLKVAENQPPVSLAVVEFKKGDESFRRFAFEDDSKTHDRAAEGATRDPDPRITTHFRPGPALLFIGGPDPDNLMVIVNRPDRRLPLSRGESTEVGPGLSLNVRGLFPNARLERRLALTPKRLQDPQAGGQRSRIKVELSNGGWNRTIWLPFHHYALPDPQYAGRRFLYAPTQVSLPDGRDIEVMFSRKRWPLPAALTLEDFDLKTHVGGFVQGNTQSIRDFVSLLRVYRDGTWSEPFRASLNKPASVNGMYFFQATWDPGSMAYTGLGVGNRNGVVAQLAGCCIAVLGMIYVFYVKPIIKRRRREKVWASVEQEQPVEEREPVAV